MTGIDSNPRSFPLLKQIDEGLHSNEIDWNQNAFQTLLTSNLPRKTIFHYAIDVGLRRLENSLYETYWDATADALNDLSQFLFEEDVDLYSDEAKCQLLMYAAIAMIKMNTIRRRSTVDAKMACATICLLLFQQTKSYENSSTLSEYSSCSRAMRCRYLKRIFLCGQWLPTLSQAQLSDIQNNHERHIALILDQLFPAVSLRDKINTFIDTQFFGNQDETASSGFVFIRRFPTFNEKLLDQHNDLMNMGLANTLNQFNNNQPRKLITCIWTLCCMIESDRVSLEVISYNTIREHFSLSPINFEEKPIPIESLNERDIIVFLLLCAQQNVHLHSGESILHPYLLFSSSHLCTQQQKTWWLTAIEQIPSNDFLDHLETIRLDENRIQQYPPKEVLLQTARILFQSAQALYKQNANRAALSYEEYANRYLQVAKDHQAVKENQGTKLFFFYAQKGSKNDQISIEQCEQLARQCDELKVGSAMFVEEDSLPPKTSSPTKETPSDIHLSVILSPVPAEKEERKSFEITDSTLFATPPSNKSRDVDVQTVIESPPFVPVVLPAEPELPAYVELMFSHMTQTNRWINEVCADNDVIQSDINTIRNGLEKINRITSQMMFNNMPISPSDTTNEAHTL